MSIQFFSGPSRPELAVDSGNIFYYDLHPADTLAGVADTAGSEQQRENRQPAERSRFMASADWIVEIWVSVSKCGGVLLWACSSVRV